MKTFKTDIKVRFNEVDGWGIVYYANYFSYVEVARAELMDKVGLLSAILAGSGFTAPIVNVKSDFKSSAKFNDVLTVELRLIPQTTAKLVFEFVITQKETQEVVMAGESTQVLLNEKGYMVFIPDGDLADKIKDLHDYFGLKVLK